jgi:hypothetical protein
MSETERRERVAREFAKHRRHIELSPGVGPDCQRYGLAVLDDAEPAVLALLDTGEREPLGACIRPMPCEVHGGEVEQRLAAELRHGPWVSQKTAKAALAEIERLTRELSEARQGTSEGERIEGWAQPLPSGAWHFVSKVAPFHRPATLLLHPQARDSGGEG